MSNKTKFYTMETIEQIMKMMLIKKQNVQNAYPTR